MEDRYVVEVGVAAAFIKTGLVRHDAGRSPRYSSSKASITFLPMIDMNPPPTSTAASCRQNLGYLDVQREHSHQECARRNHAGTRIRRSGHIQVSGIDLIN